jgi:hypothetical protein
MKSFFRTVLRELAYGGMLMSPVWHASVLEELKAARADSRTR